MVFLALSGQDACDRLPVDINRRLGDTGCRESSVLQLIDDLRIGTYAG